MNEAIRVALLTQDTGLGDTRPPPTLNEVVNFANKHFEKTKNEAFTAFLASNNVNEPVVDKIDTLSLSYYQSELARKYFGGHVEHSPDEPQGHLGSKYMSFLLQATDHPDFVHKPYSDPRDKPLPSGINKILASYPAGWAKKCLTIGEIETEGKEELVPDVFNDSSGLELVLLLSKLYGGLTFPNEHVKLKSREFRMRPKEIESDSYDVFALAMVVTQDLFYFMRRVLLVRMERRTPVTSGRADISVSVEGFNGPSGVQYNQMAIIELKRSYTADPYRAANMLAFGDAPTDEDYKALNEKITPRRTRNLRLGYSEKQLREFRGKPLKLTLQQSKDGMTHGYACNGTDVTDKLDKSYLKDPLDALHAGLVKASRLTSLNNCRHMGVSDGFTMVCVHLRELVERQPGLITANFNSRYSLDLTEDGSLLKLLQYFINAVFRDPRVRQSAMIMLTAAAEEVGDGEITPEKADSLKEFVKKLEEYMFNKAVYSPDEGLTESARVFTKTRDPIIKNVMSRFKQDFGAIAEKCGEYKSDDFNMCEQIRADELEGVPSGEGPFFVGVGFLAGRSRCILRVKFHGGSTSTTECECVLKVYDTDEASIVRLERELKAYNRIAKLSEADQKRIVKLVAFGCIDLGGADPRLFILTECATFLGVEPEPEEFRDEEIDRVHNALKSVGVHHNDLVDRNYHWQCDEEDFFVKVFDFDLATFDDIDPGKQEDQKGQKSKRRRK